jgi:non-specific serine/threonine protein kinase/serine/threonine-protein kinase
MPQEQQVANDPDYWTDVEALFTDVLELDDDARSLVLDERCGGRPAFRAEVESLIAAHRRAGTFIEPVTVAADGVRPPEDHVGRVVGSFRLVERIGTGGMSTVYRAERIDAAFSQQVAIKLMAAAVGDQAGGRRFRAERQILASLRHPHIVTFVDGGTTPDGLNYLVMEYVEGRPISSYCREQALSLPARLHLFRQVCSAVQYAHRHFVVHRDLKPSNILITPDGVPKVLDFGIAKLLDDPAPGAATLGSVLGPGPLTPNYASPEQLRGLPVTTSSDLYALGVLLYEILTGSRPYETDAKTLDEMVRLVVDTPAPRPSAAPRPAEGSLPYDPRRELKGDLDAIVLRAMSKEPERRYGSAEEMADDLSRYLAGEPVVAREPSLGYVARKLASRHKPAVVSVAISGVLVLAALVLAIWQARIADGQRQRAQQRFNDVRTLANALVFDIHDAVAPLPGSTPVRQTIVREALRYLERLAPEAQDDPVLQLELARAYLQIGKVQGVPAVPNLGDRRGAIASLTKAREILGPMAAAADAASDTVAHYVDATRYLSLVYLASGDRDRAVSTARDALAIAEARLQRHPREERARSLVGSSSFAAATATGWPGSLALWTRAAAIYQGLLADRPDDPERQRNVALVEKYLGAYYMEADDDRKAIEHHQRALALDEQRLAKEPTARAVQFDVAIDLANVAESTWRLGDPARAAALYERSLAMRSALSVSDPSDALARTRQASTHGQLARVYRELRDFRRASDHARAAMAIYEGSRRSDPADQRDLARAIWALGEIESDRGRRPEACAAYSRAFDVMRALPEAARRAGTSLNADRLVDLAGRAAGCGVEGAREWLAGRAVSTSSMK